MPKTVEIMPVRAIARRQAAPKPFNRRVVAIAYDGLCVFEFGCAVEVFGLPRPELGEGWYSFRVAGENTGPLHVLGGMHVVADGGLELIEGAGTVIVPGWRGCDAPVPDRLCAALRQAHEAGARVVSLCSGAFVLAAAGLLDGRRATTHWRLVEQLAARYPAVEVVRDFLYVDEGDILTAAGSAAGLDMFLHLVHRDWGLGVSNHVARRLVIPAHRQGRQAQFVEKPVAADRAGRSRIGPLMDRVRLSLDEEWPLDRLAQAANISVRALHRHFVDLMGVSPAKWLTGERLVRAVALLEAHGTSVDQVAQDCGFGSAAVLRYHRRRNIAKGAGHAHTNPP